MKKLFQILAIAATLVACSKDETVPVQGTYTLTGYTNVETKTDFGIPSGNTIPFEWSIGDFVWNGLSKSNLLTVGGSSAIFTFSGSEPAGTVYYNMVASNVGEATTVKIPTEQDASKTLGQNGDFGYATVENDGSFNLKHATAYLWFDIKGLPSGSTLKSIRLHAGNVCVAGTAKFSSGKLNIVEDSGRSIVDLLTDISSVTNNADAVMVLYPALLTNATITYQLTKESSTEDYLYYEQTFSGKELKAGVTSKISVNLANVELKESVIRTLTFEDVHAKFQYYELKYADGYEIYNWTDLIAQDQYSDNLLGYCFMMQEMDVEDPHYRWSDDNNTFLSHDMPYNWNSYCYAGGGHAISNYGSSDYASFGDFPYQLTVYNKLSLENMENTGCGNGGSDNFAVHYGYSDGSQWNETTEDDLSAIYFSDQKPRVIDHIWIALTTYEYYCISEGNYMTAPLGQGDYVKIYAIGHKKDGSDVRLEKTVAVLGNIMEEWTKWDLRELGEVMSVQFNIVGTNDNGYGFSQPAYFAYDDVAVVFE